MSEHIRLEIEGKRATVTLDHAAKRNMLEVADLDALAALLDRVDGTDGVRTLVVTGAGEAAFCSGFAHGDVADTDWRDNPIERTIRRLEDVRVPTVCALNGGVFGAAVDLALACDLRIGVLGMRAFMPAARLGAMYNVSGMRRLVSHLGPGPARRLLLADEQLDAEELLRIGFLDWLVPRDEFAARIEALVETLAGLAPLAVDGMKRALVGITRGTLDEARTEQDILDCFASDDLREGLAAFAERRKPNFEGR